MRAYKYAQCPAAAKCCSQATLLQSQQGRRHRCCCCTAKKKIMIENETFMRHQKEFRNAQGTASPRCCWSAKRLRCSERRRGRCCCGSAKKLRFSRAQKIKHNTNKTEKERAAESTNRSQRTRSSSSTLLLVSKASAMQRAPSGPMLLPPCKKIAVQ